MGQALTHCPYLPPTPSICSQGSTCGYRFLVMLEGCSASSLGCSLPTSLSSYEVKTGPSCRGRPGSPTGRKWVLRTRLSSSPAQPRCPGPPSLEARMTQDLPQIPERKPGVHEHSWPHSSAGSCGRGWADGSSWQKRKGIDPSFGCAEPCPALLWKTGVKPVVQCGHGEGRHWTRRHWAAPPPTPCRTESFSRTQQAHKAIEW